MENNFEYFQISQAAIIMHEGKCLILEFASSPGYWGLPGGRIDKGESAKVAFSRELKEEIVYTMHDGQIFGELSLVDGSPRSASVKAQNKVRTCRFDFDILNELLEKKPRIGYLLMKNIAVIISARIRNTNMLWRNSLIW